MIGEIQWDEALAGAISQRLIFDLSGCSQRGDDTQLLHQAYRVWEVPRFRNSAINQAVNRYPGSLHLFAGGGMPYNSPFFQPRTHRKTDVVTNGVLSKEFSDQIDRPSFHDCSV